MQNYQIINVENSINSGQVFLWKKNKEFWKGVNGDDVLSIDKNGNIAVKHYGSFLDNQAKKAFKSYLKDIME